jgi:hypothetical protein
MGVEEKKSIWYEIGKPITIRLGIVFITLLILFLLLYFIYPPPFIPPHTPSGQLIAEYDDSTNTYRVFLNYSNDRDGILRINKISVILINESGYIKYNLENILDDNDSNITFYDRDNDATLSIGDEFFIDGNIVGSNAQFRAIYEPHGKVIDSVDLT